MILSPEEWGVVLLSVRVAAAAVLLSLPGGLWLANGLARRRFRFPFVLENAVQFPLVLPPVVTGFVLLWLLGPAGPFGSTLQRLGLHVAFTWFGAALAAAVVSFPLLVQTMRATFELIDPEIEQAARVDGAGRWSVFRFVTVPLAARGVAAGVILAFARALGEFGATIVVAGNIPGQTRTIPLAIYTAINQADGIPAAVRLIGASIVLSIASLVAYSLLTRRFHRQ
ncbi:MAG: molybdate ABC transporter permease subunit [Bacteroidetes bacterium]|nr:molybdate ABC transporter permease subunit [Bacteroidota bacterium]